jgi:hypothetical protein
MSIETIHQDQESHDLVVQHDVTQAILKAEQEGNLAGIEAPVYATHTFIPTGGGDVYARVITRQLNHIAKALGVIGFQVLYKEDTLKEGNKPDHGYFQILPKHRLQYNVFFPNQVPWKWKWWMCKENEFLLKNIRVEGRRYSNKHSIFNPLPMGNIGYCFVKKGFLFFREP